MASYSEFEGVPIHTSRAVDIGGDLRLSLTVTNTGNRRGTEVVQLYAADTATGVTLPAQQLVGFARLDLEPGASKTVTGQTRVISGADRAFLSAATVGS
jgi:beta-xylosidase